MLFFSLDKTFHNEKCSPSALRLQNVNMLNADTEVNLWESQADVREEVNSSTLGQTSQKAESLQ